MDNKLQTPVRLDADFDRLPFSLRLCWIEDLHIDFPPQGALDTQTSEGNARHGLAKQPAALLSILNEGFRDSENVSYSFMQSCVYDCLKSRLIIKVSYISALIKF